MDDYEKQIRQRLKDDLPHYASKCLKIRTKSGEVGPFLLNKAQLHTHNLLEQQKRNTGKVRALILKARQQGMSTYIGARFYHKVTHSFGHQAFILAHSLEATSNLYVMAKRFYEHTPAAVKPMVSKSNAKELIFGALDSGYKLGTSENKNVGRSSTIQLLHWSEVAFSSNTADHSTGILQAVPNADGTEILLESTANGVSNFFHQQWQMAEAGLSDYIAIFVPWFWQDEYREPITTQFIHTPEEALLVEQYGLSVEQLQWRRRKIIQLSVNGTDGTKSFSQEYPANAVEAFQLTGEDSFIDSNLVVNARHASVEPYGPLLVGVDPARFGDDRTSIIFRQGRAAFGLKSYTKKDTMEVVGIVATIIKEHNPDRVMVDVGGLGAGVVDRLFELGHRDIVIAVNAGSSPLDANKYKNKRSEMWGEMRGWLAEGNVQIPDSDSLHSDLCGVRYKFDSNSRLVMEAKEGMKKRGIRSSDEADALCFVAGTMIQTAFGPFPIEHLSVGDEVVTPFGSTKIAKVWVSDTNRITTAQFSNGSKLSGKGEHKIFTWQAGECRLDALSFTFEVEPYGKWRIFKWRLLSLLCTMERSSEFKPLVAIINQRVSTKRKITWSDFFIVVCGQTIMDQFQKVMLFITKMRIGATMIFPTWRLCRQATTPECTWQNITPTQKTEEKTKNILKKLLQKRLSGTSQTLQSPYLAQPQLKDGKIESQSNAHVLDAARCSMLGFQMPNTVLTDANRKDAMRAKKQNQKSALGAIKNFWQTSIAKWRVVPISVQTGSAPTTKVYNLTLEKHNAYYANDILVFNCLTFALPNSALSASINKQQTQIAESLNSNFDARLNAVNRSRR